MTMKEILTPEIFQVKVLLGLSQKNFKALIKNFSFVAIEDARRKKR